jgi:hypothetical protein
MEIPLDILKQILNGNLSQQSVDRFLIDNLKNAQKTKVDKNEESSGNVGKEDM